LSSAEYENTYGVKRCVVAQLRSGLGALIGGRGKQDLGSTLEKRWPWRATLDAAQDSCRDDCCA
jgi:hypothetical protein